MRAIPALCALSLLAGCGMDEAEFVPEYNRLWCEHRLTCEDPALLTFEGIVGQDDCEERHIEVVSSWGDGCSFDGVQAEACLLDLEASVCPAAGAALAAPPSCDTVYLACTTPQPGGDDTDAAGE